MSKLRIKVRKAVEGSEMFLHGREAQTMQLLLKHGAKGITALDHPGIRLAHYIFKLRGYHFVIETFHEPHTGDFPGRHARYVLRTGTVIVEEHDQRRAA